MKEDLKKLGLTDNEISVYLSLLKIGETPVGGIINDIHFHRQLIYNALDSLEQKSMVTKTMKNKVNHYKVSDPKIIVENIKKQELIANRLSGNILSELEKSRYEHEINVYDGRDKIRNYFLARYKRMAVGSILYVISNYADKFEEVLGREYLANKYNKLMMQRQIKVKILTAESKKEEFDSLLIRMKDKYTREFRFIPDAFMSPVAIEITDLGINFISFEKDWFIIEIKNQDFRSSFLKYFQSLWKIAKK